MGKWYGMQAQGRDCGDEAAQWISTFLSKEHCRLVHYEANMITRKPSDMWPDFQATDEVAYAEGSPVLLISEASLDDLNSQLKKKVAITNFQPNILVAGCSPYEEDTWVEILIGSVQLKGRMSCPRCIFTTLDPDIGVMDGKEPLKTLKSYRKCDPSEQHDFKSEPPFGWRYGIDKTGILSVGDPVYKIMRSNRSVLEQINPDCSLEGQILKMKLKYFGHLMRRKDSLEKSLMLGTIDGKRRRGQQRMTWLDGVTEAVGMSLGGLRGMVEDRKAWRSVVHGVVMGRT
ncbi:Mitochondrial amidoxime reducing component 2 [Varanus komodoensis]|nr:Mitochondrial amidoxime reducing component 2 [Varanus komodoensis]